VGFNSATIESWDRSWRYSGYRIYLFDGPHYPHDALVDQLVAGQAIPRTNVGPLKDILAGLQETSVNRPGGGKNNTHSLTRLFTKGVDLCVYQGLSFSPKPLRGCFSFFWQRRRACSRCKPTFEVGLSTDAHRRWTVYVEQGAWREHKAPAPLQKT
jgi:hypothetical protein